MKKILFLILLLIGLKGFACQCMAPIPPFTFWCNYVNSYPATQNFIIKGVKIGSTDLGTKVLVTDVIYGTPPADTLLFWKFDALFNTGALSSSVFCLNYIDQLTQPDTLVLSAGYISTSVEGIGMISGAIVSGCITSYLTVHNNMVFGNVSDGVSMMPYTQLVETLQACLPTVGIQPTPLPAMAAVEEVTCHPNPIQGSAAAQVQFTLPQPAPIQVAIYDISGKLVSSITPLQTYPKGTNLLTLPAQDLPAASGIYFCRIVTPQGYGVGKLVIQ